MHSSAVHGKCLMLFKVWVENLKVASANYYIYRKIPKNWTPENIAVITQKFEQSGSNIE